MGEQHSFADEGLVLSIRYLATDAGRDHCQGRDHRPQEHADDGHRKLPSDAKPVKCSG